MSRRIINDLSGVASRGDLDVVRGVAGAGGVELVTTDVSSDVAALGVLGLALAVGVDVKGDGSGVSDNGLVIVVKFKLGVLCLEELLATA